MIISEALINEIKNELGVIKTRKAEEAYRNKRVQITNIDLTWNYKVVNISAIVVDKMTQKNKVQVRVDLEEGTVLYGYTCNCNLYSYKKCEHILAVILEFNYNPKYEQIIKASIENEKKERDRYMFNNIIGEFAEDDFLFAKSDSLEEKQELPALSTNIELVPVVKENRYGEYELSFKIGNKKMYKIKSLQQFYWSYTNKEVYRYGENLAFKHIEENFANSSKDFLKFILKYGQAIYFANATLDSKATYNNTRIPSSNLVLKGDVIDEFFDILKSKPYMIELEGEKTNLNFMNREGNIKFDIEETKPDEYKINLSKGNVKILEGINKIYTISENNVYEYDKEKYKDFFRLVSYFERNERQDFYFGKDELINFIENVLPKVRDNVSFDNVSEKVKEEYIPKKLGVKVYLDLTKKADVLASVKFCYDDVEFEPFSEKKPRIPRDKATESKVLRRFNADGFSYSKNYESYIMKDEENIYNFLTDNINYYMENYEVLVSEDFKKREIRQPKISALGVKVQNNLLNIDLSGLDFDPKELQDILAKYKLKKKYYRLKNGDFLSLEENNDLNFIEDLTDGMDVDYSSLATGKIKLPVNRSLYLNKLLDNMKNVEVTEDKAYKDIVVNTENGKIDEDIVIPEELEATLRIYQKTGYKWLRVLDKYRFGGILADDMGLGKTLQVIAVILESKKESQEEGKETLPTIVVSPSSLTLNWKNEIEKFAPSLKSMVIRGNLKERKNLINQINENDIVITSYDILKRDIDLYIEKGIKFRYIIADEAQYIKNSNTQNARSLKDLNGETRFALTGTPIENSLAELWSIFDYIMPGYLFGYAKFKREFESRIVKEQNEEVMKRLKTMIEPFILRRTKKEVLTELPDKTITVMKNEMEGEQEKLYLSYLAQTRQEIMKEIEAQGFEKSQIKILSLLTRLRQICCHPSLFIENYQGESSKLNQALQLIEDAISAGHKILLFSTYTSMFDIFEDKLKEMNIEYYKLIGSTKVDERIKMVDEFNKNPNIKVFLISLKAGGTGLNLTGADFVIHYDPWWNISAENQATDRAYRIGQKNNVQVYKLITKNSIEERINELQEKKAALIDDVLDTNQTFINKLSKEDIMSLFA